MMWIPDLNLKETRTEEKKLFLLTAMNSHCTCIYFPAAPDTVKKTCAYLTAIP
jgi:hypothetical protein